MGRKSLRERQLIANDRCPNCGAGLYGRSPCDSLASRGYSYVLKCLNPKCNYRKAVKA